MSEVKAPPTLGPNQLAWLKKNIPAFDIAWRAVQASQAHAAKTYEKMGVEPGTVGTPSAGEKGEGQT